MEELRSITFIKCCYDQQDYVKELLSKYECLDQSKISSLLYKIFSFILYIFRVEDHLKARTDLDDEEVQDIKNEQKQGCENLKKLVDELVTYIYYESDAPINISPYEFMKKELGVYWQERGEECYFNITIFSPFNDIKHRKFKIILEEDIDG